MKQLSFADLLVPKEPAPPTILERLAAGLKASRMGANDRLDFLQEQVRRMNQRNESTEIGEYRAPCQEGIGGSEHWAAG